MIERATALGHPGLGLDPEPCLVVDGRVLRPRSQGRLVHRFEVPAGAREVWLVSRSTVPAHVAAGSDDTRRLGLPVECLAWRDARRVSKTGHAELALGEGFHQDEATHCWTDGRARLPEELLQAFPDAFTLEVRLVASPLRYKLLPPGVAQQGVAQQGTAAPGRRSRDPDLHLVVDGHPVRPLSSAAGVHRFVVPGGAAEVTIASRSVVPRTGPDGWRDPRRLGVPVERIVLSGDGLRIEIDPACPALRDGFHRDEGSHRWTDGNGRLPAGLLGHFTGEVTLDLHIDTTDLAYPLEEQPDPPLSAMPARRRPGAMR